MERYDLLVIGGGINGAGIARDAAGRGLSVLLCEKDDLASHTSSASTKLIHGGLRYLEYYEFGLVRKALQEREVLIEAAPHIIWPLRFVMPHDNSQRPAWMVRMGLFLYDNLAKRKRLLGSEAIRFDRHPSGQPLKSQYHRGFVYSDGWVQDARLVVLNAMDAAQHGSRIMTRTTCIGAERQQDQWVCTLQLPDGTLQHVSAKAVVNAAGPWVESLLKTTLGQPSTKSIRLVKGSHIVVKKLFDHPYAYIFQNPDKRIIFAIPYEDEFTLIGTTDVEYQQDPGSVSISPDEVDYLCRMSNRYFNTQISPADVVSTYSGVRPLLDDDAANASSVTRDYSLELDNHNGAPVLSVFGGKITTYRKLAEQAVDKLAPLLGNHKSSWTASAPLPGGDIPNADIDAFITRTQHDYAWLPQPLVRRYARTYGSKLKTLLAGARALQELGREVAPGVFEAELRYLVETEWATTAEDILWRRTKLKLHLTEAEQQAVADWLQAYHHVAVSRETMVSPA